MIPIWKHSLLGAMLLMVPIEVFASMGMDLYLPAVQEMPALLNTTPFVIQLTLSLYVVIFGCAQLLFGPISDRVGRRPVLIGGGCIFSIASFFLSFSYSVQIFLAMRVIESIGAAGCLVAMYATVRDVYGDRPEIGKVYALLSGLSSLVPAFAPPLGAGLMLLFGWRSVFTTLGVVSALAGVHAWFRWPETRPESRSLVTLRSGREILVNRQFWIYTLASSSSMGAFFVFFSTAPLVLISHAGLTPGRFSLIFGTVAFVMMATATISDTVNSRFGIRGTVLFGTAIAAAAGMLLAYGQIVYYPSVFAFVAPIWLLSIGITLSVAAALQGALRPFGHIAGTATAVQSCLEALMIGGAGTVFIDILPADTAWPLSAFSIIFGLTTFFMVSLTNKASPMCVGTQ